MFSSTTHTSAANIEAIIRGRHRDPFSVLGPHESAAGDKSGTVIRVFAPNARQVWLIVRGSAEPMRSVDPHGFFELFRPNASPAERYRLRFESHSGQVWETEDPYSFPTTLGEMDLYLLGEGTHLRNYERLGAHLRTINGVDGAAFAVWAPNAQRVSVVGDFNQWDGRRHPMRLHPGVGVWDIFVPGLKQGDNYKFEIIGAHGELLPLKSDPNGLAFEVRPNTAAVIWDIDRYQWNDGDWLASRGRRHDWRQPMSIYEVHLGSWSRNPEEPHRLLSYREIADRLIPYVVEMGFTHVELMPVSEHPFDGSWGYQTLGYFAPTSRFGKPEEFMEFVDRFHQAGIGVIIDWVPAHFPRDDHGLRLFDGTALYEHADPRQGEHPEWGTQVFNFSRNEVSNFLIGNALFWFEKYHIDGLRVDAVASMLYLDYGRHGGDWIPNQYGGNHNLEAVAFLHKLNNTIRDQFPDVRMFAEESTSWANVSRPVPEGGLGFHVKWNMGWMNDTLRYFHRDPIHRQYHQNDLTFSLIYAFNENFLLPLSHDEVVHGKGALLDKMPGDNWQRFANLRALFGYMWTHPGKKLLFMGGEIGQWREWRYTDSIDWHLLQYPTHQGIRRWVRDLNLAYCREPALHQLDFSGHGFQWIDHMDHHGSTLSFLRKAEDQEDFVVVVCNFTPVVRYDYRVGVPKAGFYKEILNSDSEFYGGSNVGNEGGVSAEDHFYQHQPFSIVIKLPPLGIVVMKPME